MLPVGIEGLSRAGVDVSRSSWGLPRFAWTSLICGIAGRELVTFPVIEIATFPWECGWRVKGDVDEPVMFSTRGWGRAWAGACVNSIQARQTLSQPKDSGL